MSSNESFTIGWVCALQEEYETACRMLDEEVDGPEESDVNDNNTYVCGRINGHGVVIGCLPSYGTNAAAVVAKDMVRTFPNLRFALLVGIGGGVPRKGVRLGDVVVSMPQGKLGGVVQYDLGKCLSGGRFQRTGQLNSPPQVLLGAIPEIKRLQNDHRKPDRIAEHISRMDDMPDYQQPKEDRLYSADYQHRGGPDCKACMDSGLEIRHPRKNARAVYVHYGTIASANSVIKDAELRDRYANDPELDILCFEMEAAGLMNNCPCLVIRGICDYADTHKNDEWHKYAALTAAAYARELLYVLKPTKVKHLPSWESKLQVVQDIVSNTQMNINKLTKREDLEVLNWISSADYGSQHSDYVQRRQSGTGQWLFESAEYQQWEEMAGQELFCQGIPGAGKTILASAIVDKLIYTYGSDPSIGIAFIYCNYKRRDEQTVLHLFSSLVKQLVQRRESLPSVIQHLYDRHKEHRTRPSLGEVLLAARLIAVTYSRVFIIVDALDECEVSECRLKFIPEIQKLQKTLQLNVLMTSRFIPEVAEYFKGSLYLEIYASKEDIARYIDSQISRLPKFVAKHPSLQEEIKTAVSNAVQGMFLLAQLYFDSIIGLDTATAIRDYLKTLISGLSSNAYTSAYDEAMARIEGQVEGSRNRAKQVLKWISCAARPLTIVELQHALAVKYDDSILDLENLPDSEVLVSVCAGLVTIDEQSDVIRLVHYTTEEYFVKTKDKWFQSAEHEISSTCTSYLSFRHFSRRRPQNYPEFKKRLSLFPFYQYAAFYWGHHAHKSKIVSEHVMCFLQKATAVTASAQVLFAIPDYGLRWDYQDPLSRNTTGLSLAACFGLYTYMKIMIDRGQGGTNHYNRGIALCRAAERGYNDIAKLLLESGANIEARDERQQTSLFLAAGKRHKALTELLLKNGAEIEARDWFEDTPLLKAAEEGHADIVKLLLEAGAEIEGTDQWHHTPLSKAAKMRHVDVVKLLLEAGAEIEARDKWQHTPFFMATQWGGNEAVIKLLCHSGADIEARDLWDQTPLSVTAERGHEAVVRLLLNEGAEIESRDCSQKTPLLKATEGGHGGIVKLLLEAGAEVEARDRWQQTPLIKAAEGGYGGIVKLLLEAGAELEARDEKKQTSLAHATEKKHEVVVKLLLGAGASIEVREEWQQTSLALVKYTKR